MLVQQRQTPQRQGNEEELVNTMSRTDIINLIDENIVGRNAERNRAILKRRLIDGICYEPLAEEFNLSTRQVKTIVYKCKEKIISKLH